MYVHFRHRHSHRPLGPHQHPQNLQPRDRRLQWRYESHPVHTKNIFCSICSGRRPLKRCNGVTSCLNRYFDPTKLDLMLHFAYFRKKTLEEDKSRKTRSLDALSACMYRVPECLPHLNWSFHQRDPRVKNCRTQSSPIPPCRKINGKKASKTDKSSWGCISSASRSLDSREKFD